MATTIGRLLDEGADVRSLSDADYRKAKADMITRSQRAVWERIDAADLARVTAKYASNKGS